MTDPYALQEQIDAKLARVRELRRQVESAHEEIRANLREWLVLQAELDLEMARQERRHSPASKCSAQEQTDEEDPNVVRPW